MIECKNHNKCLDKAVAAANEICNQNNLRFTDLRRKVFEIISKNHKPAKAYDVLGELQKQDWPAKPSTVYRTLDFLLEYGLVHKLHSSNSYTICSHPAQHNQCYFLICDECGEIKECCDERLVQAVFEVTESRKFQVKNVTVEISGLCGDCVGAK